MRMEFEHNRLLDRFIEQDLKFESFGILGLNYTLIQIGNTTQIKKNVVSLALLTYSVK